MGTGRGRLILSLLPLWRAVEREVAQWEERARGIASPELRQDALASLDAKRFHCQGGAVYCLATARRQACLRFVVAYQTLIDYLDNLVDGEGKGAYRDARSLHRAVTEALGEGRLGGYYRWHETAEDGYLASAVDVCRAAVAHLPDPGGFRALALPFARRYVALQVLKHLPQRREDALSRWSRRSLAPELRPNEWLAGTGSSLAVFALYATALEGRARLPAAVHELHALHILLDYLIDRVDDARDGAWNFVAAYGTREEAAARLAALARAVRRAQEAEGADDWERLILSGLYALYLSEGRARRDPWVAAVRQSVGEALGPWARVLLSCAVLARAVPGITHLGPRPGRRRRAHPSL
jgi:tetraprenyl-beta-curcumene synthase